MDADWSDFSFLLHKGHGVKRITAITKKTNEHATQLISHFKLSDEKSETKAVDDIQRITCMGAPNFK